MAGLTDTSPLVEDVTLTAIMEPLESKAHLTVSLWGGAIDWEYPIRVGFSTKEVSGLFLNEQITVKVNWSVPDEDGAYPSYCTKKLTLTPNQSYNGSEGIGNYYLYGRTIEVKVMYKDRVIYSKSDVNFDPDDYRNNYDNQKYFRIEIDLSL